MGPMAAHVQFSTEKPTDVAFKLPAYTEHNFMVVVVGRGGGMRFLLRPSHAPT